MKSDNRSSISDLFRSKNVELKDQLRKFIATKYDIMAQKLQFADDMQSDFESVETIVNFICKKFADAESEDLKIRIPLSIKQKMKSTLKVRDGEFFKTNLD